MHLFNEKVWGIVSHAQICTQSQQLRLNHTDTFEVEFVPDVSNNQHLHLFTIEIIIELLYNMYLLSVTKMWKQVE
jgi:hypothetical protein